MGNSQQHHIEESIDEIYYSLPKRKKDGTSTNDTATLFFSGGGRRRSKLTTRDNSSLSGSNHSRTSQIVCPTDGIDAEVEDMVEMETSMQPKKMSELTKLATEPLVSTSIIDQLIDVLDLNFLLKTTTESPNKRSNKDSIRMSSSSSSSSLSSSYVNPHQWVRHNHPAHYTAHPYLPEDQKSCQRYNHR